MRNRSLALGLSVFAMSMLSIGPLAASDFDGEVLIAPPPPNWIGGSPSSTEGGDIERAWRRPGTSDADALERVVISRTANADDADARAIVRRWQQDFTAPCETSEQTEIDGIVASIGNASVASAICGMPDGRTTYARAMVLAGEFHTYQVVRSWAGDAGNPGNPRDSQRLARAWDTYFSRISVCNTLADVCDADHAASVHAHPRFKEMRQLQAAERPVLGVSQVLQGANAFGRITGRAEACGEDVTPLLLRVGRMFDYVTANDAESTAAQSRFEMAREDSKRASGDLPAEVCGEVRRQFREHPSRVQGFARYIIGLI